MFECVSGLCDATNISGCILADDMGLGKTLQSITLLYTLLRQGFDGKPMVKKAIIVTPTSLVSNWEAEIKKWVGDRIKLIALCESTRNDVISVIDSFTGPRSTLQVLIVSYETFRMYSLKFSDSGSCGLLICDGGSSLGCPDNAGVAGTLYDVVPRSLIISNHMSTDTETLLLDFPYQPLWTNVYVRNHARATVPLL